MAITVICSKCQKQHNAPDSLAGRAARCKCGNVIQIPALAPDPVAAGGSLFDEISAGDVERLKNSARPSQVKAAPVHPYQSPAAAQYLASAAGSVRSTGRARGAIEISWTVLGWALALSILWMVVVSTIGWMDYQNSRARVRANPALARTTMSAKQHGRQWGFIVGLGPAVILGACACIYGHRVGTKIRGVA
jgi:hypothetical protein